VAFETDKWAPAFFLFVKISKHPQFDIRIGDLPDVQISPNFAGRQLGAQEGTLLFLIQFKIPKDCKL
jgi:hypothetical protein